MEFKPLELFYEQKKKAKETSEQYRKKVAGAKEKLDELKQQYEEALLEQVRDGVDHSKRIAQLDAGIMQAEKDVELASKEEIIASRVASEAIMGPLDLAAAWNGEYVPAFKKEKLEPVLQQLLEAKRALSEANLAYHNLKREFESKRSDVRYAVADTHYYKFNDAMLSTQSEKERYFLTERQLEKLERGEGI